MKKIISLITTVLLLTGIFTAVPEAEAADGIFAATVSTQSGNLNIRSAPFLSAKIISRAPKGSILTVISDNGDFWRVQYAPDSYGYVSNAYLKPLPGLSARINTSYGNLNVRYGASTAAGIKDSLPKGTQVIILNDYGSWAKIVYHGSKTGYVSCDYIKKASVQLTNIALSVPSFKQTDSRWANVKIGSSGKTIGKIGCATTAIAMIESYKKGYNIYPDRMSEILSYSASGNVYWPSGYKAVTSSENYLKNFYELLSQGRPVLFGAKNIYGSQHWIVVTGFTGGELHAENFTINDPGSNSRVRLSQFLSVYPVFYKYFAC